MAGFKDIGVFIPASSKITAGAQMGGIDFENFVAIKPPEFRIRQPGQEDTRMMVSEHDISPIKLTSKPLSGISVPSPETMTMGIEVKFCVIDSYGQPISMYGNDTVNTVFDGRHHHYEIVRGAKPWALDEIKGLTPEGLNFQAEISTSPGRTFSELLSELKTTLVPIATAFQPNGWQILTTGLSGNPLNNDFSHVAPHPYIIGIHTHGLHGTAANFDANTVQSHVGLEATGSSIEFALILGNKYNAVLATMINALSLSAPFRNGRSNSLLSHREAARNAIYTQGGVQDNIPVDAGNFLRRGHLRVAAGDIPVPERAGGGRSNGSHNDYRPKLSTGTGEFGSADSSPNPEVWVAQTEILRRFTEMVAASVKNGDGSLPAFLEMDSFDTRKKNRLAVAKAGVDATILTAAGPITVRQAWYNFFRWAQPEYPSPDWDRSVDVIKRALSQNAKDVPDFFNPNSPNYLHGSVAIAMLRQYEQFTGPPTDRIAQVNALVATGFMGLISRI